MHSNYLPLQEVGVLPSWLLWLDFFPDLSFPWGSKEEEQLADSLEHLEDGGLV